MQKVLLSLLTIVSLGVPTCVHAANGAFQIVNGGVSMPDGSVLTTAPKDGKSLLSGAGAPTIVGNIGDMYIDTVSKTLYGPYNGSWGSGVSLQSGANPFLNIVSKSCTTSELEITGGFCYCPAAPAGQKSIAFRGFADCEKPGYQGYLSAVGTKSTWTNAWGGWCEYAPERRTPDGVMDGVIDGPFVDGPPKEVTVECIYVPQ